MTLFGLIGDLAPCKFTNKNELETDPPTIAAIVTIRPETPDFRDSYSCMDHALSFPPGGEV